MQIDMDDLDRVVQELMEQTGAMVARVGEFEGGPAVELDAGAGGAFYAIIGEEPLTEEWTECGGMYALVSDDERTVCACFVHGERRDDCFVHGEDAVFAGTEL